MLMAFVQTVALHAATDDTNIYDVELRDPNRLAALGNGAQCREQPISRIILAISGRMTAPRTARGRGSHRAIVRSKMIAGGGTSGGVDDCPSWRGAPITFILDHIDGNPKNNHVENLRLVCPNCGVQLETHGGANVGCIQDADSTGYVRVHRDAKRDANVFLTATKVASPFGRNASIRCNWFRLSKRAS